MGAIRGLLVLTLLGVGAAEADAVSNTFEMEWPPRSGRTAEFPEIDRVAWFDLDAARAKMVPAQTPFLDRLVGALGT